MVEPRLSVIIVTYNSRQEIDACLSSLLSDPGARDAEIIVVDNASADGTVAHIAARWPQVRLLAQSTNPGFAAGNNIGIDASRGGLLLLLNPDTVTQSGAIAALSSALEQRREVGIAGPMLLNVDGSLQPSCRDFPSLLGDFIGMTELYRLGFIRRLLGARMVSLSDHRRARCVDWLSGACLLVRRAALDAAGKLDPGFFMYSEEMEWQYRMAQRGWAAWFEPAARVVHIGGASTAAVSGKRVVWQYQSIWRFYRLYRNRAQRLALHGVIWAATWPKVVLLTLLGRGNAHRRELLGAFWQVLWQS
ncbi:MAG: glycosyltransferase family 2 protein [Anaerolineae bacterium]